MQNLLANAKKDFDLIIVDAPVMLTIPDVAILVPEMDGVLLVHDPTKGTREVVLEAKNLLDRVGANLLGMIFNNVKVKKQLRYQHTREYYHQNYRYLGHQRQKKSANPVDMRPPSEGR
jgi:Mrp family chromosome partitioning ATPase